MDHRARAAPGDVRRPGRGRARRPLPRRTAALWPSRAPVHEQVGCRAERAQVVLTAWTKR